MIVRNILFSFYFCLLSAFISSAEPNIYSLFYHWNKMSLAAINNNIELAGNKTEKDLYKEQLDAKADMWGFTPGSANNQSLRWLFLEQISNDFNWKNRDWSVIEVVKSGEIKNFRNYLICYEEKQAKMIAYSFYKGKWSKIWQGIELFKMDELLSGKEKVPVYQGGGWEDVVVTNFKSALPVKSECFVAYTLAKSSIISKIIAHRVDHQK